MRRMSPFVQRSHFLAVLLLLVALPYSTGARSGNQVGTPEDPLTMLKIGNKHFVDDEHFKDERKHAYQGDQHPYAIILSCSDSRVPPELVFGEWESLGKLFVIRAAGNVIDPANLGSIEYAAEHLHAKLIFVLGHERCGAVHAAVEQAANPLPPNIAWFVDPIRLAVERTKGKPEIETVKENVRVQIQNLRSQSSIIRHLEEKEGMRIAGGFFNLNEAKSGKVDFF